MYEEPEDISRLQHLLDTSLASSSEHLRSIIRPAALDGRLERRPVTLVSLRRCHPA